MPRPQQQVVLEGRVSTGGPRGHGVAGLLVEIWAGDNVGTEKVGWAYTDSEGRFGVQVHASGLSRAGVVVEAVVVDRDGLVILRHRLPMQTVKRGRNVRVRVPAAAVERHHTEPVLLAPDLGLPVAVSEGHS